MAMLRRTISAFIEHNETNQVEQTDPLNSNDQNLSPEDLDLINKLEKANKEYEHTFLKRISSLTFAENNNTIHESLDDIYNSEAVWSYVIANWDRCASNKSTLFKKLVRKGIPAIFRRTVWQKLCNTERIEKMKDKYESILQKESAYEKMIMRDLNRTFPDVQYFCDPDGEGQKCLFNVVKAYSIHDSEVGYCQGLAFIAGLLLLNMPEYEAFSVMIKLMEDYDLRSLSKPDMYSFGLYIYEFELLLKEHFPLLVEHFDRENFSVSVICSYFLTLYATILPLPMVFRIMDILFCEGFNIVLEIGLALCGWHYPHLVQMPMEELVEYFHKGITKAHTDNFDELIDQSLKYQVNLKKMKRFEKEYSVIRKKETEETTFIVKQRTENKLLKQKLENLEKESAHLAEKLLTYQVLNAQNTEEIHQLKQDLCSLSKDLINAKHAPKATESDLRSVSDLIPILLNKEIYDQKNVDGKRHLIPSNGLEIKLMQEALRRALEENHRLRQKSDEEMKELQEELTHEKKRNEEATETIKNLRNAINEMKDELQTRISSCEKNDNETTLSTETMASLKQDLLVYRLKDLESAAEKSEFTNLITSLKAKMNTLQSQMKSKDELIEKLQKENETCFKNEKEVCKALTDLRRQLRDTEMKYQEEFLKLRIKETENTEFMATLRQRIAELEVKNQEMLTKAKINEDTTISDSVNKQLTRVDSSGVAADDRKQKVAGGKRKSLRFYIAPSQYTHFSM